MIELELAKEIIAKLEKSGKKPIRTLTIAPYQRCVKKEYAFCFDTGHTVRISIEENINNLVYKGEALLKEQND